MIFFQKSVHGRTAVGAELSLGVESCATVAAEVCCACGSCSSDDLLLLDIGGVLDLLIESSLNEAEEKGREDCAYDYEKYVDYDEQYTCIRNTAEQSENQGSQADCDAKQEVSKEHLSLVALGALGGELDSIGDRDFGLSHEYVGGEAVLISANNGKYRAYNRDKTPNEDPKSHPAHAAEHALYSLPVFEAIKKLHCLDFFLAVAAQENHGHGSGEQK